MNPFYLLCGLTVLFAIPSIDRAFSLWSRFALFFLILLASFLAGTSTAGADISNYVLIYEKYNLGNAFDPGDRLELGFKAFALVFRLLGAPFALFLTAFEYVFLSFLAYALKRTTPLFILAFLLYLPKYYFVGNLNQVREASIFPLVFLVLGYMERKEPKKLLLATAFGMLFHFSALLMVLPALFFRFVPLNRRTIVVLTILSFVGAVLLPKIIEAVSHLPVFQLRGLTYFLRDASPDAKSLFGIEVFRRLFFVGMILFFFSRGQGLPLFRPVAQFYLLSVWTYISLISYHVLSERISALLGVVEPLLVLWLVQLVPKNWRFLGYGAVLGYFVIDISLRKVLPYVPDFRLFS